MEFTGYTTQTFGVKLFHCIRRVTGRRHFRVNFGSWPQSIHAVSYFSIPWSLHVVTRSTARR